MPVHFEPEVEPTKTGIHFEPAGESLPSLPPDPLTPSALKSGPLATTRRTPLFEPVPTGGEESPEVAEPLLRKSGALADYLAQSKASRPHEIRQEQLAAGLERGEKMVEQATPTRIIPTLAKGVGQLLGLPLQAVDWHLKATGKVPEDYSTTTRMSEDNLKLVRFFEPLPTSEGSMGRGAEEFIAQNIAAFEDPAMWGALAAGTKYPAVVARLFQAQMVGSLPETLENLRKSGTPAEAVKESLSAVTQVALPRAIEAGLLRRQPSGLKTGDIETKPEVKAKEPAATVGPATADAVREPAPTELEYAGGEMPTTPGIGFPVPEPKPKPAEPTPTAPVPVKLPRGLTGKVLINELSNEQILKLAEAIGRPTTLKDLSLESRRKEVTTRLQELEMKGLLDKSSIEGVSEATEPPAPPPKPAEARTAGEKIVAPSPAIKKVTMSGLTTEGEPYHITDDGTYQREKGKWFFIRDDGTRIEVTNANEISKLESASPKPKPAPPAKAETTATLAIEKPKVLPPSAKQIPPNSAFIKVVNYDGNTTGFVVFPHDGTIEGIKKASKAADVYANQNFAWKDEFYNAESQRGATDETGKLKWVVSPNAAHVAESTTPEAAYILGDLDAYKKDRAKRAVEARKSGDVESANKAIMEQVEHSEKLASEHEGFSRKTEEEYNKAVEQKKAGTDVKTLDPRFSNWKEYLAHLKSHVEWQMKVASEYRAEAAKWRGQLAQETKPATAKGETAPNVDLPLWTEIAANTREFNAKRTTKARKQEIIERQKELRQQLLAKGYSPDQVKGVEMLQTEMPTEAPAAAAKAQGEGTKVEDHPAVNEPTVIMQKEEGEVRGVVVVPSAMMPYRLGQFPVAVTPKTKAGDFILSGHWSRSTEGALEKLRSQLSATKAEIGGTTHEQYAKYFQEHEARAQPIRQAIEEHFRKERILRNDQAIADLQASGTPAVWSDEEVITPRGKYSVDDSGKLVLKQELSKAGFEKNLDAISQAMENSPEHEGRWWGANKAARERIAEMVKERETKSKAAAEKKAEQERVAAAVLADRDAYFKEVEAVELPKGKKQMVTIPMEDRTTGKKTTEQREMTAYGSWAIKKNDSSSVKSGYKYFVTHVPTGLSVGSHLKIGTLKQAQDLIKGLVHTGVDASKKEFSSEELGKLASATSSFEHGTAAPQWWIDQKPKPEPPAREAGPGTGEGPGSPVAGDVPPEPPPARVNVNNPSPVAAPSTPIITRIRDALRSVGSTLKGMAGDSMPKTTAANRPVGEAGVRYASSRIAARPMAAIFSTHTLEGTGVDPIKFGTALSEDNLRSVRETFRQQATEAMADGKPEEADAATAAANRVRTLIGEENSPFRTEDEYQDFLAEPSTRRAIRQHIQQWNEIVEPMYRHAQGIDPDVELPTRGQQTGARVNLKVVFPEDEVPAARPIGPGQGASLTATFKRKSPFGIKARGTGEVYEGDYHSIIANTFERQLEIANKNAFDKALVENGLAVVEKPGQRILIDGKPAMSFPLQRRLITVSKDGESKTFPAGQNIYVRSDLAREYRIASNVDASSRIPIITPVMNFLNQSALAGLTDFTIHTSNLATALFNRPVSGKLLSDSLLSATGRADVPVSFVRAILKATKNNQAQIADIARIGGLRAEYGSSRTPLGFTGKVIKAMDRTVRLVLDDTFKSLAEQGLVENTETARREYINQIGQYNRRLQGPLTRLLRDTGFGPFVTAGKTFNAMGVKMATLSPNAKASSNVAAAALRANVASKWIGGAVLLGTLNYLLTHNKGGGVMGRPGTPLGKLDTGLDDKNKRPLQIPLFDIIGLGRGLRVTGVRAAIDAKRFGLTYGDAFDSAARDIINSAVGPAAGPPVRFGMVAATGFPPAMNVGRASPVVPPGQNQVMANIEEAVKQANPIVGTALDIKAGKSVPDILSRQIPRFTMSPGKPPEMMEKYPKIVGLAQTHAYADDIVRRARQLPPDKRRKFVTEALKPLNSEQRKMVVDTLNRRKVRY